MGARFITQEKSELYEASTGERRTMVLIFGDEVQTTGSPTYKRVPVEFRGRPGFVQEKHLGQKPALELYFIDVGQGDSAFIVTPGRRKILIDGGVNRRALGFLAWKYRLDRPGPVVDIDLMVLSHADKDHLNGLAPIVGHPRINVRRVIHSGVATFQPGAFDNDLGNLDPTRTYLLSRHNSLGDLARQPLSDSFAAWRTALVGKGVPYAAVDAKSGAVDVGDPEVTLEVLGPCLDVLGGQPVLRWFGGASRTINGHSVVLRLTYGKVSALLPGDVNIEGARRLLAEPGVAARLDAHVFKAPHHGSREFHPPFLKAVRPQISVISSGNEQNYGHPSAMFIGAVGMASRSASPLVFATEIAAAFVEEKEKVDPNADTSLANENFATPEANAKARWVFKRRLHGMINVRTDGQVMYAARRVASAWWWESYGPVTPAPCPDA
jgi:hypothetical protein